MGVLFGSRRLHQIIKVNLIWLAFFICGVGVDEEPRSG